MTERIENYARIIGKYFNKERIIGTHSGQSDLYTWIVTNNIVVYTLQKVCNMTKDQGF